MYQCMLICLAKQQSYLQRYLLGLGGLLLHALKQISGAVQYILSYCNAGINKVYRLAFVGLVT